MATCHGAAPASSANPDTALLTDIGLAILGAPTARFADYERRIRAENAWVAPEVFAVKRRAVLRGFLERPAICAMPILHQRLQRLAHDNLRRATADSQSGLSKPHQ